MNYDLKVSVFGGGLSGQAGAIRHGLSKALIKLNIKKRKLIKISDQQ